MSSARTAWKSSVLINNLTVNQILKYTPSTEETIQKCGLRSVTEDKIFSYFSGKECQKYIQVSKYLSNFFVCYRFVFVTTVRADRYLIPFDPYEPYNLKYIKFNKTMFDHFDSFLALHNSESFLPKRELEFATQIGRGYDYDRQKVLFNLFGLRSYTSTINRLEPPYTTQCKKYNYADALKECINNSVVKDLNRLSPISQHIDGNLRLVTAKFLDNHTNTRKYSGIVKRCRENFPKFECQTQYTISSVDDRQVWNDFIINIVLPDTGSIIVDNFEKMLFIDYITFALSCFGTWMGFSFLGLNPFESKRTEKIVDDNAFLQKQFENRRLIHLLFQGMKQQQQWIEANDEHINRVTQIVDRIAGET